MCTTCMYSVLYLVSLSHQKHKITQALYSTGTADYYRVRCYLYVSVAVPKQDSMSPARVNAVLSGHCNRFVGYP